MRRGERSVGREEERLLDLFDRLAPEQQDGLIAFAEFLAGKPPEGADLGREPLAVSRPEVETVTMAIRRLVQTYPMLDRRRLNLLKPEAGLINIGRSPVVDYDALREKLEAGTLAGAVLDVFQPEPLAPDSPLWNTPNLVITPHVSCDDPRYVDRLLDFWFENLARFVAGKRLKNLIDRDRGY